MEENNNEMNSNVEPVVPEVQPINMEPKKNNGVKILIAIVIVLVLVLIGLLCYKFFVLDKKKVNKGEKQQEVEHKETTFKSTYRMSGNSLEDFDLYFMQLENNEKNIVYSPLSIKYALSMLKEGTDGNSKAQIEAVVGDYISKKYVNSKNMSLANALFIRDSYKEAVNKTYIDALKDKYNAEVIYDSFSNANNINKWVSEKTFNLIPNLLDNVDDQDFVLTNALAIDMEWVKVIQPKSFFDGYRVIYANEEATFGITSLDMIGYNSIKFNGSNENTKSVEIGASANKYDIVGILGEDSIRKTVKEAYEKWIVDEWKYYKCDNDAKYTEEEKAKEKEEWNSMYTTFEEHISSDEKYNKENCDSLTKQKQDMDEYLDKYIEDINSNYKQISSSTDFEFYVDDDVKVFAKDLKEYNGSTLQYIGIMPQEEKLSDFIKNVDSNKLSNYINNLKEIKLDSFEEGYITQIDGYIPLFNFEYEVKLQEDLEKLGITDVFDIDKANLSKITSGAAYINSAKHKANIEFSNEGIKAAAATSLGGAGATGGGFRYLYKVPIKKIDLTFDKPYMFIIRDKDTGEVWFAGSVYTPSVFNPNECYDEGGC